MHKALAKIERTSLGYEDHGIFTSFLQVSYEGASAQGVGGYCLDEPRKSETGEHLGRFGTAEGMQFIINTLAAVGVDSWEKLIGQLVWVLRESDDWGARVLGIQGVEVSGKRPVFLFASLWPQHAAA